MIAGNLPVATWPFRAGRYRSAARFTPSRIGTRTFFSTTTSYSHPALLGTREPRSAELAIGRSSLPLRELLVIPTVARIFIRPASGHGAEERIDIRPPGMAVAIYDAQALVVAGDGPACCVAPRLVVGVVWH